MRNLWIVCAALAAFLTIPDQSIADCRGNGRSHARFFHRERSGGCHGQQASAGCQGGSGGSFRQKTVIRGYQSAPVAVPAKPAATMPKASSALEEVNYLRAVAGLTPYQEDLALTAAAEACATYRAAYLIPGHADDFQFLPAGGTATATGCAAWPPQAGWGSCCIYENHRFAGAGWRLGRDGNRYMSLFVR